jgi:glycosyltransferase involved in cell wall biosynthesis
MEAVCVLDSASRGLQLRQSLRAIDNASGRCLLRDMVNMAAGRRRQMSDQAWWRSEWGAAVRQEATLSVIVPVYNERYLVGAMLSQLKDLSIEGVSNLEILTVDDGSTDGSDRVLEQFATSDPERFKFIKHLTNRGKGAAVRSGIEAATGDLIVFQDADLEYDPRDYARLVRPFLEDGADVVYGSRFGSAERRRVLLFRHQLGNRLITFISNLFTDLNLSDVETCYKMLRAPLLKSIPLRSNDFAMEIEITAKVAKRQCNIFEVPISYRGRTYREGKKIGWRDGVKALYTAFKYWLIDDLYRDDAYGGQILHSLDRVRRFNGWMADAIRPWLGARVLEIGAGIGNITGWMIPRDLYVASDINSNYLHYLQNFAAGKPYLEVERVDLEEPESFTLLRQRFDTVICLNVLEHVRDPLAALQNIFSALEPGGRVLLYVPSGPKRFSSLDEALGHRCRYDRETLESELSTTGFEIEHVSSFNRFSVPGWWWNGRVLKKRSFSRLQLKLLNALVPILRRLDRLLPWKGLGLIAIARRPHRP